MFLIARMVLLYLKIRRIAGGRSVFRRRPGGLPLGWKGTPPSNTGATTGINLVHAAIRAGLAGRVRRVRRRFRGQQGLRYLPCRHLSSLYADPDGAKQWQGGNRGPERDLRPRRISRRPRRLLLPRGAGLPVRIYPTGREATHCGNPLARVFHRERVGGTNFSDG